MKKNIKLSGNSLTMRMMNKLNGKTEMSPKVSDLALHCFLLIKWRTRFINENLCRLSLWTKPVSYTIAMRRQYFNMITFDNTKINWFIRMQRFQAHLSILLYRTQHTQKYGLLFEWVYWNDNTFLIWSCYWFFYEWKSAEIIRWWSLFQKDHLKKLIII